MGNDTWLTTSLFTLLLSFSFTVITLFWATVGSSDFFFSTKVSPVCLPWKHTDMGKTHIVSQVSHEAENLYNPKYRQIPGSSGTKQISRCRAWQECHTNTTTLAGIFSVGKNMGRGKWDSCILGGRGGGWGRCCHAPVRFPTVYSGVGALPVHLSHPYQVPRPLSTCVCVCLSDGKSYCSPVFSTDFLINDSGRSHNKQDNGVIILDYYHSALLFMEF